MTGTPRKLRSSTVALGGMGLLAVALTACSSDDPDKRCVDRDSYTRGKGYETVAEKHCKSVTSVNGHYYYGGKKKSGWVSGGSFDKSGEGSGSSSSGGGVDRGGFGDGDGSGSGSGKGSSGG